MDACDRLERWAWVGAGRREGKLSSAFDCRVLLCFDGRAMLATISAFKMNGKILVTM